MIPQVPYRALYEDFDDSYPAFIERGGPAQELTTGEQPYHYLTLALKTGYDSFVTLPMGVPPAEDLHVFNPHSFPLSNILWS